MGESECGWRERKWVEVGMTWLPGWGVLYACLNGIMKAKLEYEK